MKNYFSDALLTWFDLNGRKDLPWQSNITPYRIWISEIMLQQTQVATVIPYFHTFTTFFPTIQKLATADLNTVLHYWTGLGYYARARNMHRTANIIHNDYQGIFPDTLDGLIALPGIGKSTAGAILSIAFQKATPILDGNVKRVLCRYHAITGYPNEKNLENTLWSIAKSYTPLSRCAHYTQAIMDLGATVCRRTQPKCMICPLQSTCKAFASNKVRELPTPKNKINLPIKKTVFIILHNARGEILLEQRPPAGIWGGLWSFPECQEAEISLYLTQYLGTKDLSYTLDEPFRHTFSHYHLDITPVHVNIDHKVVFCKEQQSRWVQPKKIPKIGLAAPVKKLLQQEAAAN